MRQNKINKIGRKHVTWVIFYASLNSPMCLSVEQVRMDFSLAAECTTQGTDWDGSRYDCHSNQPSCYDAPPDFVIVEKSVSASCTSCNGSEYSCDLSFHEPIEVIQDSGITQSRKVCLSAYAKSPGGMGNANARGWAKCVSTGKLSSYKR